jgi:D-aminoacyl-tRNA deacylase
MIGLLQRVTEARITVDGEIVAATGPGLLVLVAVGRDDTAADVERLTERILTYRVFADGQGRMNLSLVDLGLDLMLVPQFTLAADTRKGRRASFTRAANPDAGRRFFELMLELCRARVPTVASGIFGADMKVALVNDGPVTFWLES